MLNAKYDRRFPVGTAPRPMFRLLGTRPADERLVVSDAAHLLPRAAVTTRSPNRPDRDLRPVR